MVSRGHKKPDCRQPIVNNGNNNGGGNFRPSFDKNKGPVKNWKHKPPRGNEPQTKMVNGAD